MTVVTDRRERHETAPERDNVRGRTAYKTAAVSILALLGLARFSISFFLARRPIKRSSSCNAGAASGLLREVLNLTAEEVQLLRRDGLIADGEGGGCWTPRRVDGLAVVVVDALRFDFALGRLPKSIGARLGSSSSSQLFTFVADPPTVTMQRLKGLTTGGLPTFADILGSFGGASVDEDTWVQQLNNSGGVDGGGGRLAFVGDDTWIDLFPDQFHDAHKYPSFNTRDLDTVDDGCMLHLPRLLRSLGGGGGGHDMNSDNSTIGADNKDQSISAPFDVIVAHFLGVDHVGHTYGPNDRHMTNKLHQMDDILSYVLDGVDAAKPDSCRVVLIFGDHGMTEDGNHGGGTDDETNAALFAHFSPGCSDMSLSSEMMGSEVGTDAEDAYRSIHQIDLVPTISAMMGLPIPYANLGGLVPALLLPRRTAESDGGATQHQRPPAPQAPAAAVALALNAAQVWNYLTTYSRTANALPAKPLSDLSGILRDATNAYKSALSHPDGDDSLAYRTACGLYKLFLSEATELGKRVWTKFDTDGMILGIVMLVAALICSFPSWPWILSRARGAMSADGMASLFWQPIGAIPVEVAVALLFMVYQCAVLTFSNSYIECEEEIIMFALAILCVMLSLRRAAGASGCTTKGAAIRTKGGRMPAVLEAGLPLLVAFCSRANSLFITGHGLDPSIRDDESDPSIRKHVAHNSVVSIGSLALLAVLRWNISSPNRSSSIAVLPDLASLVFLSFSWWEKRSHDHSRNGYFTCGAAMIISLAGVLAWIATYSIGRWGRKDSRTNPGEYQTSPSMDNIACLLFKCILFTVAVTGPSTAASALLFLFQAWALYQVTTSQGQRKVLAPVLASLWRLAIRHAFFATGHKCSFSGLHYSAAFVATKTFYFHWAGISLFMNTFGWEIIGSMLVLSVAKLSGRGEVWRWFCFYQLLEAVGSCISVSLMRRHLMAWAIFAPRFVFAAVFTALCLCLSIASCTEAIYYGRE